MTVKSIVREILPAKISGAFGSIRMLTASGNFGDFRCPRLSTKYTRRGCGSRGNRCLELAAKEFWPNAISHLYATILKERRIESIVDAGCGDFNVGSRLCSDVTKCIALDVSSYIIDANQKRYGDISNVNFQVADLIVTTVPTADLVLIRQVLQHLTNDQIERVLHNLDSSTWRSVLVTEAVTDPSNDAGANLDLRSHSVRTRVNFGSGVFVDRPPFNRPAKRIAVIDDASPTRDATTRLLVFELTSREAT